MNSRIYITYSAQRKLKGVYGRPKTRNPFPQPFPPSHSILNALVYTNNMDKKDERTFKSAVVRKAKSQLLPLLSRRVIEPVQKHTQEDEPYKLTFYNPSQSNFQTNRIIRLISPEKNKPRTTLIHRHVSTYVLL